MEKNSKEMLQYQLLNERNEFLATLENIKQVGIFLIKKYSPDADIDLLDTHSLNEIVDEIRNLSINQ